MRERHVVTCFLEHGGRVLVLRRSQRVGTYRGRWAGVSGSVEARGPLAQAYTELREETGLGEDDLVLMARAEAVTVEAPELDTRWVVHPFLFHALRPEAVRLDWEHTEQRWVAPGELAALATVPGLAEVLARFSPWTYPEEARERVRRLVAGDRDRGASELADEVRRHLARLVALGGQAGADALVADLEAEAARVAQLRPTMVAVAAAAGELCRRVRGAAERGADLAALRSEAWRWYAQRRRELAEATARMARDLVRWLPEGGRVATLSHSGTVRGVLLAARARLAGVTVLESRPRCEGRELARRLAAEGLAVTVVPDGAAWAAAEASDLCLVGADAVGPDGSVVNKTGTAALALAARRLGRPVLVCATTDRRTDRLPPLEAQPADELWSDPPAGVRVENRPFERVPADLVTAVLTEAGPQTRPDAEP